MKSHFANIEEVVRLVREAVADRPLPRPPAQIGRASCRERV
jgi:hypothetical protein